MKHLPQIQNNIGQSKKLTNDFQELSTSDSCAMTLLFLIHTKAEHRLYQFMLSETRRENTIKGKFSNKFLFNSGLKNEESIRRACKGLIKKKSIDQYKCKTEVQQDGIHYYTVYSPSEILVRRESFNGNVNPKMSTEEDQVVLKAAQAIADLYRLSRRETEVMILCTKGSSNIEIANSLFIQLETVKFHMKNIFLKTGIKRRTELMSKMLRIQT